MTEQIRCESCGPLDWTVNAYGRVTHKHDCSHSEDTFCQAHPRGCEDSPAPLAFEWRYSQPIPDGIVP